MALKSRLECTAESVIDFEMPKVQIVMLPIFYLILQKM